MSILIMGGELVNPKGVSGKYDIIIENGKVLKMEVAKAWDKEKQAAFDEVIDATKFKVMPGFVDMHVHLREPGFEYKEDINSGTLAAVYGGFTSIACMPNTAPVNDDITVLSYIKEKAKMASCKVYPICAITKGQNGAELAEMGILQENGAVGFSDDGKPVKDPNRMRLALQYSKNFDSLIISHCEDVSLADNGVMNEGYYSAILGLAGINNASEAAMVARDVLLAKAYGARLHICHVSTAESIDYIRLAKAQGVQVTCETAPHYFSADDSWVDGYDTNTKMNPPLRSKADVKAICQGLKDGTIDAIATDHAPHCQDEKRVEYNIALNGIVGLETAFSLGVTNLVNTGILTLNELVEKMSCNPSDILKIGGGVICQGAPADITIASLDADVVYTPEMLHSKSKNTPFLNRELKGRIMYTIVDGNIKVFNGGNV